VLKGGGGEAERVPAKPATAFLWTAAAGVREFALAADAALPPVGAADAGQFVAVWRGTARDARALATVRATLALALLALGRTEEATQADALAADIWERRAMSDHLKAG
jgi:hypothetical protein